jgi:hypothetical protein
MKIISNKKYEEYMKLRLIASGNDDEYTLMERRHEKYLNEKIEKLQSDINIINASISAVENSGNLQKLMYNLNKSTKQK